MAEGREHSGYTWERRREPLGRLLRWKGEGVGGGWAGALRGTLETRQETIGRHSEGDAITSDHIRLKSVPNSCIKHITVGFGKDPGQWHEVIGRENGKS